MKAEEIFLRYLELSKEDRIEFEDLLDAHILKLSEDSFEKQKGIKEVFYQNRMTSKENDNSYDKGKFKD